MRSVWLFLLALSFPIYASNIADISIKEDKNGMEILLKLDGKFDGVVEQKQDGENTILIFNGLDTALSTQKSLNSSIIDTISVKPEDDKAVITLQSKKVFDLAVSNTDNGLLLRLVGKSMPLSIEEIANDANDGGIVSALLDALYYVVIILAIFGAAFFVFVKLRLFPRKKQKPSANAALTPTAEIKEEIKTIDGKTASIEIKEDTVEKEEPAAPNAPIESAPIVQPQSKETPQSELPSKPKKAVKPKEPPKKAEKQKGLFD